ncbi:tetratricopeptide repeat protein [Paenibacillus lignilyticus]|uniref:Tetratricopeptide repeat protein n=1 Tax=Paenibacillus lignilyticus TaxID=1172615 RepID=A0ABS5CH28_9BACL|nr:tetratricopeptide repeat protein [Paenibacillus lignilyticus]MBP3965122.1 tetratricopeptide repeat protein [Paenibacillus lignilyticus]
MDDLHKAISLREAGQLEEARQLLLTLVKKDVDNPQVWYQCAWAHDVLELEREAIPYYRQALALGITGKDRQGAYLGLGSTFRVLGEYTEAKAIFEQGLSEFPECRVLHVFYAMVLYNLKDFSAAMAIMLRELAETSEDAGIRDYKRAILYYSVKLDEVLDVQ